ncbi:MAG: quinolinate synthase [Candidatus Marinamargulisbacteria bacterium]|jgi:quinolinate synthase
MSKTAQSLYQSLKHVDLGSHNCHFSLEKCEEIVPLVNEINALKKEKNAVILAHSYVSPEILYGVADFMGDSYELSKKAQEASASTIVFSAVKFMAETAKLLNPTKTVLVPNRLNGCSLADSITGEDVKKLRKQYPSYTFVCYINTTADVKAECDVCVTSSNVYGILESLPNVNIFFLPDKLMGENVISFLAKKGVHKNIKLWDGTCYVHEEYDPEMIRFLRLKNPTMKVASHPECSGAVLADSDFVGSTSQLINYVKKTDADAFFLLTECGLTTRLQAEAPGKTFVGTCTMCKYMKSNRLEDILRVLKTPDPQDYIEIDPDISTRAVSCIEKMFELA